MFRVLFAVWAKFFNYQLVRRIDFVSLARVVVTIANRTIKFY